jgi:PhzF family phenazine biosynthesis protein
MTQGAISFGDIIRERQLENVLSSLNIHHDDISGNCPVQVVSTGNGKVLIGLKDIETLHKLNPNMEKVAILSREIGVSGFYVFTMTNTDVLIHGRMFAPAFGVNEDPVTGNANSPLGAYLVHHRLVKHDNSMFRFKAVQGEAIKRAGTIFVEVKISNNEPEEVKISGNAVIVFKSELTI